MERKAAGCLIAATLLGLSAYVQADETGMTARDAAIEAGGESPHHLSGNVGVYSDYLFRGISYAHGHVTAQAAIDYVHDSGFFVGMAYTGVNKDSIYGNTYEIDLYGGYQTTFANGLTLTTGLMEYYYPQNKEYAGQSPNVTEVNVALDYRQFNLKYSHSLTDWFGANTVSVGNTMIGRHMTGEGDSKGSHYIEASYVTQLPGTDINCVFHVGHQVVRNYHVADYTDYSIGINKDFSVGSLKGWNAGLSYVMVDANDDWYVANDGYKTAQNKFFGYIRLSM